MPQGLGAALAMPVAGRLTDEVGARVVIPTGIVLALLGTAVFTQVGADTSYALLSAALFVIGLGLGATIMPSMAVAYQAVPREAVAQATTTINVVQRIAGSVGTALLAVVLQRSLAAHSTAADAFGAAFTVATALVAVALVPALLLPRLRPRHEATPAETAPVS
jgi:MFS family permease